MIIVAPLMVSFKSDYIVMWSWMLSYKMASIVNVETALVCTHIRVIHSLLVWLISL